MDDAEKFPWRKMGKMSSEDYSQAKRRLEKQRAGCSKTTLKMPPKMSNASVDTKASAKERVAAKAKVTVRLGLASKLDIVFGWLVVKHPYLYYYSPSVFIKRVRLFDWQFMAIFDYQWQISSDLCKLFALKSVSTLSLTKLHPVRKLSQLSGTNVSLYR